MQQQYGDDVQFVGVAGRDDLEAIQDFIDTLDVDAFPHAVDESGVIWASFNITTQPSFVFLNDDGTGETHVGALGVDGLIPRLEILTTS